MKSLVTKYPWPLTLLLLLPLKPQGEYWDYIEYEMPPTLRDYFREFHSTGPTKPPTKERIIEMIIADPELPLIGDDYCDTELFLKNVYYKLRCYPEHYFVSVPYKELQKACYGKRVCLHLSTLCLQRRLEIVMKEMPIHSKQ
ncbi:hypothetical protein A6R68_11528 [Neotoma lepida]|uniref:Ribonuclease A-domain domain-containing protein n=1 Tax=Neotoma lepida TaxID=56216 RepID=A0A1A6FW26_NEOLE|nr:hypothetical protein A6R68_11528 [Neotoma lepida]